MDSNAFGVNHLPSQALVVLSEAASGLNEVLRSQRPFQPRVSTSMAEFSMLYRIYILQYWFFCSIYSQLRTLPIYYSMSDLSL